MYQWYVFCAAYTDYHLHWNIVASLEVSFFSSDFSNLPNNNWAKWKRTKELTINQLMSSIIIAKLPFEGDPASGSVPVETGVCVYVGHQSMSCSVRRLKLLAETQISVWTEFLVNIVQVNGPARARKGHFALVIMMFHWGPLCAQHCESLCLCDRDNLRETWFLVSKELICSSSSPYVGGGMGEFRKFSLLAGSFLLLLHQVISLVRCIKGQRKMCPPDYEHHFNVLWTDTVLCQWEVKSCPFLSSIISLYPPNELLLQGSCVNFSSIHCSVCCVVECENKISFQWSCNLDRWGYLWEMLSWKGIEIQKHHMYCVLNDFMRR